MAAKANPSALLKSWRFSKGFELMVVEAPTKNTREKIKRLKTVTEMRDTEKGRVELKTDQVLMLLNTSTQEENAAPYSLQVCLLDYKALNTDLLASIRKGLPAAPSLIQVARKHPAFATVLHTSVCDVCREAQGSADDLAQRQSNDGDGSGWVR